LGAIRPIHFTKQIQFDFSILITGKGGVSVGLNRVNDLSLAVLLQTQNPMIRGWNSTTKKWESVLGNLPEGEWVEVRMDCDVEAATYTILLLDEKKTEIAKASLPFNRSLLEEAGLNTICVNPQSAGLVYIDNVTVKIKEE